MRSRSGPTRGVFRRGWRPFRPSRARARAGRATAAARARRLLDARRRATRQPLCGGTPPGAPRRCAPRRRTARSGCGGGRSWSEPHDESDGRARHRVSHGAPRNRRDDDAVGDRRTQEPYLDERNARRAGRHRIGRDETVSRVVRHQRDRPGGRRIRDRVDDRPAGEGDRQ